jgi:hypothetical protein
VLLGVSFYQWAYECRVEFLGVTQAFRNRAFQHYTRLDGSLWQYPSDGFEETLPDSLIIFAGMKVLQAEPLV